MIESPSELAFVLLRWVAARALDGTLFAAVTWVASISVLRRANARVHALAWSGALVSFVMLRPFELPAVGLRASAASAVVSRSSWLGLLYVSIVFLLLLRLAVRQYRLRRQVERLALGGASIVEQVRRVAGSLRLSAPPEVRISEALDGPFTLGPTRPTLVLPRWLCVPGARLDAVLSHELAHLAHRDHAWLWVQRLVTALFFAWPPVYWVARKLDAARELACDERAIEHSGLSPVQYANYLVEVVAAARGRLECSQALAIGRSAQRLEQRIDHLLQPANLPRARWLETTALILLALLSLVGIRTAHEIVRPSAASVAELSCDGTAMCVDPTLPEPR